MKVIFAFVLLSCFIAAPAAAQELYKSVMPDGKVVYGEKPEPGAKHVEKLAPPPPKTEAKLAAASHRVIISV